MTYDLPPLSGTELPHLRTELPGPASRAAVDLLAQHECPAITARRARRAQAMGASTDDPFIWAEARGANVRDADGNTFVDLTAGFAVALLGHAHPKVVAAAQAQTARLVHAMGDAWPDLTRARLLATLSKVAPGDLDVAILGLSGADAVDAAIKTAVLATGRNGVITFTGGYHGLALGVLGLQGYKPAFTDPFRGITHPHVRTLPFACDAGTLAGALQDGTVGMVMVEPVQGRGGMRTAPTGWLSQVAQITRKHGALLAFDEIQCGLGRTGTMWAGPGEGVLPDLLCVGKALGGGFPVSATLGSRAVMDAWGASTGEAIHTQTFLGHPVGSAAALAALDVIQQHDIPSRCARIGGGLTERLRERGYAVRGRGLMLGVQLGAASFPVCRALQRRGFITLPAGQQAEVVALTPPAVITADQQEAFLSALDASVAEVSA